MMADDYYDNWKAKDAQLRAQGFLPSKLGPGVPAITTTGIFGTSYTDDCGMRIPAGLREPAAERKPRR